MVTEHTNTVYNCGTCAEPKYRDVRHGDWLHIRHDSLCDDALDPVPVKLRIPARHLPCPPAQMALLDAVFAE